MHNRLIIFSICIFSSFAQANTSSMDQTEISISNFQEYIDQTGYITNAEKQGGMVYENGWVIKPNWNWKSPYGIKGHPDEPAVHITYDEAQAYCTWRGKRLPTRDEWINFAYTEQRSFHPEYEKGITYTYPTGDSPEGANCLNACGNPKGNPDSKKDFSPMLMRGHGHARVGTTKQGINGLYDMGANVWEWALISPEAQIQATMGGSWWYGSEQMQADYGATKARDMAAVYIGFRCFEP
jgi:sulfatase modifying factor 1